MSVYFLSNILPLYFGKYLLELKVGPNSRNVSHTEFEEVDFDSIQIVVACYVVAFRAILVSIFKTVFGILIFK